MSALELVSEVLVGNFIGESVTNLSAQLVHCLRFIILCALNIVVVKRKLLLLILGKM